MPINKIVICTDGIFPHAVGGMQRHSAKLIEWLCRYPMQLVVLHPHPQKLFQGNEKVTEIQISPVDPKKNYLRECYRYSRRVYAELLKHPDAVIFSQGLSVWYKADEFKHRLIVHPHGLEPFQAIGWKEKLIAVFFKRAFRSVFSKAGTVISLGGRLTDILHREAGKEKVVVIPNAADSPVQIPVRKFPEKNGQVTFLFVSRFASNKGIHILMECIRQLKEEGMEEKIKFVLAGKGPLFEQYSTNYKFNNVQYPGFVKDEDLFQLYAGSDIFILPTLFEGMPTVVLEAMSCGLPVVVTDVGATAELVDNENGFLIEKNNVEELKKAILLFYSKTAGEKEKMSRHSIEKFNSRFTWEKATNRFFELFQKIIQQSGKRGK